ncbi:MAG: cob(I)yrinic acid a,c-diamide adenosyltransferase [Deltaproteobacteria bacterium]|nr:cob(I)yrinic acid a,c-diamide adenosyltransferase [Deltaproteobacteria bacterium]
MNRLEKGYIQIYTGKGKGKTTAALGQALRAAGGGLKTFIVQFMKDFPYGEIKSLQGLENWIELQQYGNDGFVLKKQPPGKKDLQVARQALRSAQEAMLSGQYDIVILDEICVALHFELLKTADVVSFMEDKPEPVELILTGRYCPQELIKKADLVTDMKEIKHYYSKGVIARKGIES